MTPTVDTNTLGSRGEHLVYLRLTSLKNPSKRPLFRPAFLGEKYPTLDFYVELEESTTVQEFFLLQVKTTMSSSNPKGAYDFQPESTKGDLMLRYPAPTYFAFVEEDTERVFLKSVHSTPLRSGYNIDLRFLLEETTLEKLRDEVRSFWSTRLVKPQSSYFHDNISW